MRSNNMRMLSMRITIENLNILANFWNKWKSLEIRILWPSYAWYMQKKRRRKSHAWAPLSELHWLCLVKVMLRRNSQQSAMLCVTYIDFLLSISESQFSKHDGIRPILPSTNPVLENIGSIYPFYVYDGNRQLTPILRQRPCSLMYDIYWLAWWWCLTGSEYLEYNPGSELIFTGWTWKLNKKLNRTKNKYCLRVKQKTNNNRTILNNNTWQQALFTNIK
jgi:hypothetical protein